MNRPTALKDITAVKKFLLEAQNAFCDHQISEFEREAAEQERRGEEGGAIKKKLAEAITRRTKGAHYLWQIDVETKKQPT